MIEILPYHAENPDYKLFSFVYLHNELEEKYGYDLCLIKDSDLPLLKEGITEVLVQGEKCMLFYWLTSFHQHGLIIYPNSTSYDYCLKKLKEKSFVI